MKIIIDRFEDKFAVCELEDRKMVDIDKKLIPQEAKEGDVLEVQIKVDPERTLKRKTEMNRLTEDLWT